ncbi:MAG TPA: transcriptional repressor [Treponemataceae bacterium]|jgi:Fur family peroxide stress response transcriptional regulator|nr:MAG: Peroxide operon regulator [Spirochaetes bacterium ADurb.Bin269]TAH55306.1 MAG: transcriptional repressor [Treponema sp.]HOC30387.1 transcriptional repressor [Treponemataceae bacterium]HQL33925.1 transcriptional repressor [Treponemataceae bacterium]
MIINKKVLSRRNTRQRAALLELLASVTCHPDACWLYGRLKVDWPGMSLGTVYRNLAVLAAEGQVRVLHIGGAGDRFDGDTSVHYHVFCTKCGAVADVPPGLCAVPDADSAVSGCTGYSVSGHSMDFFGLCPECQKGLESGPSGS